MADTVSICNLALTHIGSKNTVSAVFPPEKSNEARQCNKVYKDARDYVLRAHQWGFAKSQVILADLGDPPTNWLYKYKYPNNCLLARKIVSASGRDGDPVPFEVRMDTDGITKVILCDVEDAELVFTIRATNVASYDPMFIVALSWWVAFMLSGPLTGGKKTKDVLGGYQTTISDAWMMDMNEGQADLPRDAEHIRARA